LQRYDEGLLADIKGQGGGDLPSAQEARGLEVENDDVIGGLGESGRHIPETFSSCRTEKS